MFEKIPIVLASGSPRRQELLRRAGLNFTVKKPYVPEDFEKSLPAQMIPEMLAKRKAKAASKEFSKETLILAADTIVLFEKEIIGKPKDREEAIRTLKKLSGNAHQVITGVCLLYEEKEALFSVETTVFFKPLREDQILYYVDRFKPLDKAGSYGIQEWIGLVGIEKIHGDYFNVVGLPVSKVISEMEGICRPS